jgi:hypothetical protein
VEFAEDEFAALVDEMRTGLDRFTGILDGLPAAAARAVEHWYVPGALRDSVRWLVAEAVAAGRDLAALIGDLLAGGYAPILLFRRAWQWRDIHGQASGVASALSDQNLVVDDSAWSGPASDSYGKVVAAQSRAATQFGALADGVAANLAECASAGIGFYIALGVIVAKLLAAAVTAAGAFGTGVLCLAGVELILEEAGFDAAAIGALLSTLGLCLAAQARQMVALHGLAVDRTAYPDGAWPLANTATWDDATITDGDADWSLRRR